MGWYHDGMGERLDVRGCGKLGRYQTVQGEAREVPDSPG